MTPILNDQLSRVRTPGFARSAPPQVFRVGERGEKNGMPYTVKGFGAFVSRSPGLKPLSREHPRVVWMLVKYQGCRRWKWDALLIGDTNSFAERIVLGGPHRNPVFTHYWPKQWPQPL